MSGREESHRNVLNRSAVALTKPLMAFTFSYKSPNDLPAIETLAS